MRAVNSWRKRHFLATDVVGALLLSLILIGILHFTTAWDILYGCVGDNLAMVYRTTASVSGALVGFSMTITVIALNSWQTDWFDLIKQDEKSTREIWKTLRQTTWSLVLLTVISLVCTLIDSEGEISKWTVTLFLLGLSIASARLIRAINVIHKMTEIVVAGSRRA